MNLYKQLKRRKILFTLLFIIINVFFSSQSTNGISNSILYNEIGQTPKSSTFTGNGKNFTITQYAIAESSSFDVSPTTSASFTLTQGWMAENISITTENTSIYSDVIQNGILEDLDHDDYYPNWDWYSNTANITNENHSDYIRMDVGEDSDNDKGELYDGDIAYFYQTVSIDEEEDANKAVSFSFDVRCKKELKENSFLYAAVIINGIEYNYTREYSTMIDDEWYYPTLTYFLEEEGQSLPGNITFRLGSYANAIVPADDKTELYFDNVEYNIWTLINEPHVLIAEDSDTSIDYYYTNSSSGRGIMIIDIQKEYSSTQDVQFSIRKNSSIWQDLTIGNLTISADLKNSFNSSYSTFSEGVFSESDDILWTFDATSLIPVSYTNRYFVIEKPEDWEIISAVDSYLTNNTANCIDIGYGTTSFTVPTNVFSNGVWGFRSRSKSWFDDANIEYWNGTEFEERSQFFVDDKLHFKVDINNTVTLPNTNMNFTIYNPNGTIWYEESREPTVNENYFGNFTIGTYNMTIGTYSAEAVWTNNLSSDFIGKIGYKTFSFDVIHRTNFMAMDSSIKSVPGEAVLVLVKYEDIDLNKGISLATIEYNSTFGQTGSLQYAGGGFYFLDLDTSSLDYTTYYLSFNASKTYYDNQTASNVVEIIIESEGMILEVPRQAKSVSANSYALFDFNLTGEISEVYLSADSITTDWTTWYNIQEQSLGQYQLNVSTWGVTSGTFPETFAIHIYANKTGYTNTSDLVLMQVNPIATSVSVNGTFVRISASSNFSINVTYSDVGSGTHQNDAACNVTWLKDYSINSDVNGFIIEFNTTGLALDQYTATIECAKSGYQTKIAFITVLVDPIKTSLVANESNIIQVFQGKPFTISLNYTDYYTGDPLSDASCYVSWIKDVYLTPTAYGFDVVFNTTGLDEGQYTAILYTNKSGYETRSLIFTILIQPLPSEIILLTDEPVEFYKGATATISVDFLVEGLSFSEGNITLRGDVQGSFLWNGTEYVLSFDTSDLSPKIYYSQILANASGVELQVYDLFVRIRPVELEIIVSSRNFVVTEDGTNSLEMTIYDSSHNSYITEANLTCRIDNNYGTIIANGDGTYTLNLNQFDLEPKIAAYNLNITITNPYGDDVSILISVVVPRDFTLVWWIGGSTIAAAIFTLASVYVYNSFIKVSKFQRNINFVKKNIKKPQKLSSKTQITEDEFISEIIKKEIKQIFKGI